MAYKDAWAREQQKKFGSGRQYGREISDIKPDHVTRYWFAQQHLPDKAVVLDLGCGIGYGSTILSERAEKVVAIEASRDVVNLARVYWHRDNIEFVCNDAHLVVPPDDTTDVVCLECLEHLASPISALWNCHRPGRRLTVSVPNMNVKPERLADNPFHMRHYTPEELDELLATTGWRVVERTSVKDARGKMAEGTTGRCLLYRAEAVDGRYKPPRHVLDTMTIRCLHTRLMERCQLISDTK